MTVNKADKGGIMKKLLLFFAGISIGVYAKESKVASTDKLYQLLAAAPYSLVFFYNRDANNRQNIRDTMIMLRSLRKDPTYHDANLQIIIADVSRDQLMSALERYGITTIPTFITFIGQEQVGEQLQGFTDRAPLMAFIDKNLEPQMNKYLQEKKEQRKRELEIARIDAYKRNYWLGSPYWDSYWYGGYYPYWFGPYFW